MKKIQHYEITLLLRHDDNNATQDIEVENIKDKIKKIGGLVWLAEYQGKKRLAYQISGEDFADYVYLNVSTAEKDFSNIVSSYLNNVDSVLRYLIVNIDDRHSGGEYHIYTKKYTDEDKPFEYVVSKDDKDIASFAGMQEANDFLEKELTITKSIYLYIRENGGKVMLEESNKLSDFVKNIVDMSRD